MRTREITDWWSYIANRLPSSYYTSPLILCSIKTILHHTFSVVKLLPPRPLLLALLGSLSIILTLPLFFSKKTS